MIFSRDIRGKFHKPFDGIRTGYSDYDHYGRQYGHEDQLFHAADYLLPVKTSRAFLPSAGDCQARNKLINLSRGV
jgi:hypothetical protein